jgi:uncharacterized membrane protein (UPF0127 family)
MSSRKKELTITSKGQTLSSRCVLARSAYSRLVGLLNHDKLAPGEGLLLDPCNQVHTFFMKFPIDVVFLNKRDEVVAIKELKPWRMSKMHFSAKRVLELPVGTCRGLGLRVGDRLEMSACSN